MIAWLALLVVVPASQPFDKGAAGLVRAKLPLLRGTIAETELAELARVNLSSVSCEAFGCEPVADKTQKQEKLAAKSKEYLKCLVLFTVFVLIYFFLVWRCLLAEKEAERAHAASLSLLWSLLTTWLNALCWWWLVSDNLTGNDDALKMRCLLYRGLPISLLSRGFWLCRMAELQWWYSEVGWSKFLKDVAKSAVDKFVVVVMGWELLGAQDMLPVAVWAFLIFLDSLNKFSNLHSKILDRLNEKKHPGETIEEFLKREGLFAPMGITVNIHGLTQAFVRKSLFRQASFRQPPPWMNFLTFSNGASALQLFIALAVMQDPMVAVTCVFQTCTGSGLDRDASFEQDAANDAPENAPEDARTEPLLRQ